MASEITINGLLKFVKGTANVSLENKSAANVTGTKYSRHIQNVGTSEEAIELGDVANPAYLIAINRDATNYVTIRSGTGAADLIKIRPGNFALFEVQSAAPFIIANTGACDVEFLIIEE